MYKIIFCIFLIKKNSGVENIENLLNCLKIFLTTVYFHGNIGLWKYYKFLLLQKRRHFFSILRKILQQKNNVSSLATSTLLVVLPQPCHDTTKTVNFGLKSIQDLK